MKIGIKNTTMRFPKVSLKKCFLFTVAFAVLLLFGFTLRWGIENIWFFPQINDYLNKIVYREKDIWTSRTQHPLMPPKSQQNPEETQSIALLTHIPTTTARSLYEDYDKTQDMDNSLLPEGNGRPWYFSNGVRYPAPARINRKTKKRVARLFPYEDSQNDRITNQLMFVPPNYEEIKQQGKLKTILLYNGLGPWNVRQGKDVFQHAKCPVNTCTLTANREHSATADMILFKDHYIPPGVTRQPHQIYMLYFLECPYHTQNIKFPSVFNWTATYR